MRGIMEIGGEVVKNKREGIRRAIDQLEYSGQEWVYVMRYDNPEEVWFTVGYGDRDVTNHVKLKPMQTRENCERMEAKIRARCE